MSPQEINRKHIMYGFIAMLILTFMCGCSGMQIQYPATNCVDYVHANKDGADAIHFGYYTPVTKFSHVWIERDGDCFDNMNQDGFNCDSELYKTTLLINPSDNLKMLRLLCKRPSVNGYKSCEVNESV